MITVACVLKSGGDYDVKYVINLFNAIQRNVHDYKFKFICLSDEKIPKPYKKQSLKNNWQGWWSKVELFRNVGKFLYFDLDTVIIHNIDCMFEIVNRLDPNEFVGVKAFNPIRNQKKETMFNSGIMAWNGDFRFIYDNFYYEKEKNNPNKSMVGDQDYISRELRNNEVEIKFWQDEIDGIYSYKRHCKAGLPNSARVVCFHGHPRPHELAESVPWVKENWC